jgi:mRNA-degrading endonuclease toxin of MazEF toxin-antitoxin module
MTAYEFGDVVLVPFPFTDQSTVKKRPAVVVNFAAFGRERTDLIIMAVTSQSRPAVGVGGAGIARWKEAGLLKPSVLKPILATVDRALILRRLGRLEPEDCEALAQALRAIIGP